MCHPHHQRHQSVRRRRIAFAAALAVAAAGLIGCASYAVTPYGAEGSNHYWTDAMPRSFAVSHAKAFCEKQGREMHITAESYGQFVFACTEPGARVRVTPDDIVPAGGL